MEMLARSAQVLIALGGAYVVAFWFVLVVWTFRDIEARSRSVVTQVVSTLMVVLFFVPGVLLYLILRPKETLDEAFQRSLEEEYLLQDLEELPLCGVCHRYVEDDFVLCPHCHAQLREPCVACSRLVDLRWPLCPYCATVQHGRGTETERVEAPAARWTAPNLRRRRPTEKVAATSRPVAAASNGAAHAASPAAPAEALSAEEERVAAAVAEPRATPFTLVSGMRSIVRPLDRVLGKDGNGATPDRGAATATTGNDAQGVEGNGAGRRFGPSLVDDEADRGSTPFAPSAGNGKWAESQRELGSVKSFPLQEGDRRGLFLDDERGDGEDATSTAVPDGELVDVPGRRR